MFGSLDHDARIALRSLGRSPGFLITAVLSLALGIGASAAAFSVIDAVRLRSLPFRDGDRLVLISELPVEIRQESGGGACRAACNVSYVAYDRWIRRHPFRSLDAVAAYTSGAKALGTGGEPLLVTGGVVSENLFPLMGVRPLLGRGFSADDNQVGAAPVVVLSHDLWSTHFGRDPGILGRTVKLSDTQYTVIGVMPAGFDHEVRSQFWLPVVPTLDPSTRPSIRSVTVIGRLAPGMSLAQLRAELTALDIQVAAARSADAPPVQLAAASLRTRYTEATRSHDLIFGAVVACVLLIACANLANLLLVRTLHQQREFAVRAALGAGTVRLAGHLLAQNAVVVVLGAATGLLLAWWSLDALRSMAVLDSLRPSGMEYRIDGRVVGFTVGLAAVAGMLLSVVPARLIARTDPQQVLWESAPTAGSGGWGRRAQQLFVVAQIASAVVLLTGGALMSKTVLHLARVELGFEQRGVVQATPSFPHPWRVRETYVPATERILVALRDLPEVSSVALRASLAASGGASVWRTTPDGRTEPLAGELAPAAFSVDPTYFATLGIRLVRGRAFADADRESGIPAAIVNEWAARTWWPGQNPLGKTIRVDSAGASTILTVVGVVDDNRAARPHVLLADDGPEIYRPYAQAPTAFPTFLLRSARDPAGLLKPTRETLARLVPDRPVFATLVSEQVDEQLRGVRTSAIQI
ncbi:MAG TPA: ABC transporter permease, partial [Gemmatimonadaceae bacterium]|nr:ABC transporter permease [Gemmatimonadaceae bacterium]